MAGHIYLIFQLPLQAKEYFVREAEKSIGGRTVILPETSTDIQHAHRFNPESAVVFRNRYREQFAKAQSKYEIFVEDSRGNRMFEVEREAPPPTEDNRSTCFVEPDGFENSGLGFLVRPAIRPAEGFCWCVKASDIPSLAERASAMESIYGTDPIATVNRMLATWGNLAQPSPAPWAAKLDDAQAKQKLQEFNRLRHGPGRRRPGNEY